jgi:hypothetical protein
MIRDWASAPDCVKLVQPLNLSLGVFNFSRRFEQLQLRGMQLFAHQPHREQRRVRLDGVARIGMNPGDDARHGRYHPAIADAWPIDDHARHGDLPPISGQSKRLRQQRQVLNRLRAEARGLTLGLGN